MAQNTDDNDAFLFSWDLATDFETQRETESSRRHAERPRSRDLGSLHASAVRRTRETPLGNLGRRERVRAREGKSKLVSRVCAAFLFSVVNTLSLPNQRRDGKMCRG